MKKKDQMKAKTLTRSLGDVKVEFRKVGDKEVMTLSASSEYPVERWFGTEILSHEKGAVRMERIKAGAVPYLFNHDSSDPRGMVLSGEIVNKRLMVDVNLFDTPEGRNLRTMIEGGMKNVSLRYRIYEATENVKDEEVTITDWEPIEISSEPIPADPTVGVGRGLDEENEFSINRATPVGGKVMTPEELAAKKLADEKRAADEAARVETRSAEDKVRTMSAVEIEGGRRRAISNLCKANKIDDRIRDTWIGQGISIEEVSDDLLRVLEERGKQNPEPASKLGLSPVEVKKFSILRAVRAIVDNNWTNAPFELEASREVAKRINKIQDDKRFFVPFEVLQGPRQGQRDLDVHTSGPAGGYLVGTDNQGFIEILRNRSVAFRMGARRLSGLQGNVTIPRQSGAATAYWLTSETDPATESQQTFAQVALLPKTVAAYTEISRLLMLQSSPAVEGIVNDDLAQVVALAVDKAALAGTGTEQPTGILEANGVPEIDITTLDYEAALAFQVALADANVMPQAGGYVTTPALAALAMKTARFSNTDTPLWEGNVWDGKMCGFHAMSSKQITTETVLFGDWQELVIGEWGVLEVEVNPFANFKAGIYGIRAMYTVDVALRRVAAFAFGTGVSS